MCRRGGRWRSAGAAVLVAGCVAALLTGCEGDRPDRVPEVSGSPAAAPGGTQYEALEAQLGPGGQVSLAAALQAFSVAVTPLPGVGLPAGRRERLPSGTFAVNWLLPHWAELTAGQRAAAERVIGPVRPGEAPATGTGRPAERASRGGPRAAFVRPTADGPGTEPYRALIDELVPKFAALIGRPLRNRVFVTKAPAGVRDPDPAQVGSDAVTRVLTPPDGPRICSITLYEGPGYHFEISPRAAVAHEVVHCFLFELQHDVDPTDSRSLPPWIGEGFPAWAGEAEALGTRISAGWWRSYLTNPGEGLDARAYSAFPFWAHVADHGLNPWTRITAVATEALRGADTVRLVELATGGDQDILDGWASSFRREPGWGPAWEVRGYAVPPDRYRIPPPFPLLNGQQWHASAGVAANEVAPVELRAEVVVVPRALGSGRWRLPDGDQRRVGGLTGTKLCTLKPAACVCPKGTRRAGERLPAVRPGLSTVAVGGYPVAGQVVLQGLSLAEYCGRQPTTPPPGPVDPCVIGRWTSSGVELADRRTTGGSGIVFTVTADGSFTLQYDPMSWIQTEDRSVRATFRVRYHGSVAGRLGTSKNRFRQLDGGGEGVSMSFRGTYAGVEVGRLDRQPMSKLSPGDPATSFAVTVTSQSYRCRGTQLVSNAAREPGPIITFRRG